MHRSYLLIIPIILISILACTISANVPHIETVVQNALTNVPTLINPLQTAIATTPIPNNCPATPTGKGLGFSLANARSVMEASGQFTFTTMEVNGQAATVATLSDVSAKAFPAIAQGFSAVFIGDPCNLSEIKITIPRTEQDDTVTQAIALMTILFAGVAPAGMTLELMAWLTTDYSKIPVGGQEQKTIDNVSFTLKRDASTMVMDILPAQ